MPRETNKKSKSYDEVSFTHQLPSGRLLDIAAYGKVIAGDYHQPPHLEDLWFEAVDIATGDDYDGITFEEREKIERRAESLLFEDFNDRRGCA